MSKLLFLLSVLAALLLVAPAAVVGQGDPVITIELTPYEGNPVIRHGEPGAWDSALWYSRVIYHNGQFHMLYHAYDGTDVVIGYATSEDGLNWVPYEDNPVLKSDPILGKIPGLTGIMVEGDTWVMYLCSVPYVGTTCDVLYRATAPDPTATWTIDPEPILEKGAAGDWDYPQFFPGSFLKTDDGYKMYFHAQNYTGFGMATSPDGIAWTKYDDPATTEGKYAASDPVMTTGTGSGSWDARGIAYPIVGRRDEGFEMFYFAPVGIGYAMSEDGINWSRHSANPVFTTTGVDPYPDAFVIVDGTYYLYYTEGNAWNISVATGTVTWE